MEKNGMRAPVNPLGVQVISSASVIPVHLKPPPPHLHPVNHRLLEVPVSNQSPSNYYCNSVHADLGLG